MLSGTLAINYQSNEHILEAGDSVYFDSSEPHSYLGRSQEAARAIVVTTPIALVEAFLVSAARFRSARRRRTQPTTAGPN